MAANAGPLDRNRLGSEPSPYLQQHADNPVHWQPWDQDALEAARELDRPIFLSIGYAACHWCHVMEEESFEDPDIAALLNEHFVPIKVDREERPDVDSVYMTVSQLVTGGGGWPLSVFLTPDLEPFYVGTYFPPEPRRGQPGFGSLLRDIVAAWSDPSKRESIEARAEQWRSAASSELESVPDTPAELDPELLGRAASAAQDGADGDHGGFGRGQKFPHPGRIHLLLRHASRADAPASLSIATDTLDAMANGGLYDHIGGGFHRYTVDRDWTVPHFEKMLYDNAEIPRAYLAGYQVTGEERYAAVVHETIDFLEAELRHPDGGFFSTLDARSPVPHGRTDGEPGDPAEGAYYVWTPGEVEAVVDDELDASLVCDRYGIDEPGNFEGRTVLTRHASVEELATGYGLSTDSVRERLEQAESAIRDRRAERPKPARDEKVISAWNGLAIHTLAEAGYVFDDDRYLDLGLGALGFLRERVWDGSAGRLARHVKDGTVSGEGYLEDYAFLARGALACYEVTGDVEHLDFAMRLSEVVLEEFWDPSAATLYYTPKRGEALMARPQELDDASTPSSVGVAVRTLLRLDHFRPDRRYEEVAETVLERHASSVGKAPLSRLSLVLASDELQRGLLELTASARQLPPEWPMALRRRFLPDRLFAPRPGSERDLEGWLETLALASPPPIWAHRETREGHTTYYVCRRECSPPLADSDAVLEWIDRFDA